MATPTFDLVDVIRTIQKQRLFIIIMVVLALILGGVFLGVKRDKYKAASRFLVNNPLYSDRSNLFRIRDTRYVDYFGGDDDLDKITAFANSDTVKDKIIRNSDFNVIYRQDYNDPKGHTALMTIFNKNFNLKRSEYKDIEVSYIAYDAQTAANVVNMAVKVLAETYQGYYYAGRDNMYTSINDKVKQLNVTIDSLTDSLAAMRDRYGIYSMISPSRQDMINGDVKGSGKGFGKAVEQIQNIESVKDQLVSDRAHYISTLNEFSTSANESMTLLKVISRSIPPTAPYGPGTYLTLLIAGFLGLFFSVFYVLMIAYYRKLNAVVR